MQPSPNETAMPTSAPPISDALPWEAIHPVLQELPAAYVEVDLTGTVRAVNRAACKMHHLSAEDLIGHSIWEFVPADEADSDRAEFMRTIQLATDPPVVRRSLFAIGYGYRIHELHRRILRGSDGHTRGMAAITFDVSELEAAHREADMAKRWMQSAIQAIPQAVIMTDAMGFVRFINPSAQRLTGWTAKELVGQQIEKGMPILRAISRGTHQPLSFRITLHEPWNGDVELLTRERQTVSVWLSASPIIDPGEGHTTGVVIVLGSPKTVVKQAENQANPDKI